MGTTYSICLGFNFFFNLKISSSFSSSVPITIILVYKKEMTYYQSVSKATLGKLLRWGGVCMDLPECIDTSLN